MNRLVVIVVGFLALVAVGAADAPTNRAEVSTAERRFQTAASAQADADMALTREQALRGYRRALVAYAEAAALRPDHYPTHFLWATCLTALGNVVTNNTEQLRAYQEADQRFAVAASCPGIDQPGLASWVALVMGPLLHLAPNAARREELCQRAVEICERGLPLPAVPTPQGQLHRYLGIARSAQARATTDPARQQALLETAVTQFRQARQAVLVRDLVDRDSELGVALVRLGQLLSAPPHLREAVTELEAALRLQPGNQLARYNLAVAHSLLGETEAAARQLTVVFDNDPAGAYLRLAEQDRHLAAVRGTPAYTGALDRRRRRLAEEKARDLFQEGSRLQQTAERVRDPAVASDLFRQVVDLYQQTIALVPDHSQAQARCAIAFVQLCQLHSASPEQQSPYREAARERFAAAARCPEVDPGLYNQWAGFLLNACYPQLKEPADQERTLREACQVLEEGVQQARFSGVRGRLEAQLAICQVLLAQNHTPQPAASLELHTASLKHFQAAVAADTASRPASFYELWGNALLRVGRATHDAMRVRQCAEQYLRSLELRPGNPAVHYNLACAYALSGPVDQAVRQLELSFANDPQQLFRRNAVSDPDLESLRELDAFRRLMEPPRPPPINLRPTVSGK